VIEHEVATMDATSDWPAVRTLRAWEAERLAVQPGERLVDVGCGPGDAALALAPGEIVGVDADAVMLRTAVERARASTCPFRPVLADAAALPLADGSCDAARSERTLQWVPRPEQVVAEMRRALRPGGRLTLIDTDWSTLTIETGDDALAAAVRAHVAVERRRPSHVGRRLRSLAEPAGLVGLEETTATHVAPDWDAGLPPLEALAADIWPRRARHVVAAVEEAARRGELHVALTIYSVAGRRP
jgi:SAM-dependent methyltransferase